MASYEQPLGPEEKLNAFREEMRAWVARQTENKKVWEARGMTGDAYDPHAEGINPDYLTEDDRAIAEKISAGTITSEEWGAYTSTQKKQLEDAPEEIKRSMGMFRAYMANVASPILMQKELDRMKRDTR